MMYVAIFLWNASVLLIASIWWLILLVWFFSLTRANIGFERYMSYHII
jgi:hypothetical protein